MDQSEAFGIPELLDERNTQLPAEFSQVPDSYLTTESWPHSWTTGFQTIGPPDFPSYQYCPPAHIHEAFKLPPQPLHNPSYRSSEVPLTYSHRDQPAPQYPIRNVIFSHSVDLPLHATQPSAGFSASQPSGGQNYLQETTYQYSSDQHCTPTIHPSAPQHLPNILTPNMTALPPNSRQTRQYQSATVSVLSQLTFTLSERILGTNSWAFTTRTTKGKFF